MKKRITLQLDPIIFEAIERNCCVAGMRPSDYVSMLVADHSTNKCIGCGVMFPELFMVANEVWEFYVIPAHRSKILCLACWRAITERIDGGAFAARHGQPLLIDLGRKRVN